ncbi:hypothetical protein DRO29_05385 [Candidatus Bathyarchaeota archaeon]|nr:MAG: hypothetical protein DRO29_05385 [Candidatus Bathyarchaeota archaeon]
MIIRLDESDEHFVGIVGGEVVDGIETTLDSSSPYFGGTTGGYECEERWVLNGASLTINLEDFKDDDVYLFCMAYYFEWGPYYWKRYWKKVWHKPPGKDSIVIKGGSRGAYEWRPVYVIKKPIIFFVRPEWLHPSEYLYYIIETENYYTFIRFYFGHGKWTQPASILFNLPEFDTYKLVRIGGVGCGDVDGSLWSVTVSALENDKFKNFTKEGVSKLPQTVLIPPKHKLVKITPSAIYEAGIAIKKEVEVLPCSTTW